MIDIINKLRQNSHDGIRVLNVNLHNIVLNSHWPIYLEFCDVRIDNGVPKIKEMVVNALPEYKL